jgi:tetrathionate reductase subunit B
MSKHTTDKKLTQISRRGFIKSGTAALAAMAGAVCTAKSSAADIQAGKKRLAMVIDLDRCVGCQACTVACKAEHGVRLGVFRAWVSQKETGKYPAVKRHYLPRLCNHCENPACEKVCPTGATFKRDDGIVAIDHEKCIGCRHCMGACPYNARYYNPDRNPSEEQFPAGTHGTVDKCDFCLHRVDNGVVPACVNTCPSGARIFGDLNDPDSEVSKLISIEEVLTLLPQFGTGPSVFYRGGDPGAFETNMALGNTGRDI